MHEHRSNDEDLYWSVRHGQMKKAMLLLESCEPRQLEWQTARGEGSALYWAAVHGFTELVRLLLERGACVNARTSWNATPLHAAADTNRCDIARLLLARGAALDSQTERGDTPCHMAAYRGHACCVQLLVEAGADLDLRNTSGHDVWNEASDPVTLHYLQAVAGVIGRTKPLSEVVVNCPRFADENCEWNLSPDSLECPLGACLTPQLCAKSGPYPPMCSPSTGDVRLPLQQQQNSVTSLGFPVQRVSAGRVPAHDDNDLSLTFDCHVPPSSSLTFCNIPPGAK